MDCEYPCTGDVPFAEVLTAADIGSWQEASIPLACFADRGADLSQINAPLVIASAKPLTMTLKRVAISSEATPESVVNCQ
jgi:beta-glucosidase